MEDPQRPSPRLISVVVPLNSNAGTLPAQLRALAAQGYDGPWEVIVADNGSSDGSRRLADSLVGMLPGGRVIDATGRHSASYARNRGAAATEGDFLLFTDADDIVAPTWLSAMARAARLGDLVAGEVTIDTINAETARSWHATSPRQRALADYGFLIHASGSNTGVWRDVFQQLGGFDEHTVLGEDIEFSWRAQLDGYRLCFAQDAVVHERLKPTTGAMMRQHFRYGTAGPHLYRRFAGAGMPRSRLGARCRAWVGAAWPAVRAPWSSQALGRCALESAYAAGRVVGSVRARVLYV